MPVIYGLLLNGQCNFHVFLIVCIVFLIKYFFLEMLGGNVVIIGSFTALK